MNFDEWMEAVDARVWAAANVSVHDLPDWHFMDAYTDGAPPEEAAVEVLENAGWLT